jgi:hypothetical protein
MCDFFTLGLWVEEIFDSGAVAGEASLGAPTLTPCLPNVP